MTVFSVELIVNFTSPIMQSHVLYRSTSLPLATRRQIWSAWLSLCCQLSKQRHCQLTLAASKFPLERWESNPEQLRPDSRMVTTMLSYNTNPIGVCLFRINLVTVEVSAQNIFTLRLFLFYHTFYVSLDEETHPIFNMTHQNFEYIWCNVDLKRSWQVLTGSQNNMEVAYLCK